jgi:hypothetical protein
VTVSSSLLLIVRAAALLWMSHSRAAAPATCGAAIEVPENPMYPPPRLVEMMSTPGAAISTSSFELEKLACVESESVAATETTSS